MPATTGDAKLLTAAEARERIGVSREQLRRLIKDGEIQAHKTGGAVNSHYRISEQAVADYLERHAAVPAKAAS
jgi:excisionase family DNA binding protein